MANEFSRRLGQIQYSSKCLSDDVAEALGKLAIIPVATDYDVVRDRFVMTGVSRHFAVLPHGYMAPLYEFTFERSESGLAAKVTPDESSGGAI